MVVVEEAVPTQVAVPSPHLYRRQEGQRQVVEDADARPSVMPPLRRLSGSVGGCVAEIVAGGFDAEPRPRLGPSVGSPLERHRPLLAGAEDVQFLVSSCHSLVAHVYDNCAERGRFSVKEKCIPAEVKSSGCRDKKA